MPPCADSPPHATFWSSVASHTWQQAARPGPRRFPRSKKAAANSRRAALGLLLLLYCGLAGVWAWRLRPAALPEADPQRAAMLERAVRFLSKAPPETLQPILMSVALLPDSRLALLDTWLSQPPLQQLRQITVQDSPLVRSSGDLRDALLLAWIGQEKTAPLAEAHLMITAAGARLDAKVCLYALDQLATRAQAAGQADTAATILHRACSLPTATWESVRRYVQAARATGQQPAALRIVSAWIERHPAEEINTLLDEARDLEMTLQLHMGRAEAALSLQLQLLENAPADRLPERTLDRALHCARAAAQPLRVLPWIEKHLATFPEHALDWHQLLGRTGIHPDYHRWLQAQAAISDSELPAARAWAAHLRLAAIGDPRALVRLSLLAPAAGQESASQDFLTHALGQPVLRTALLEQAQTPDPLARRTLATALHAAPGDHALHYAATLAKAANEAPGTAALTWQAYLRRFPEDIPARRRLIQSHLAARQPTLALRAYQELPTAALTAEDRRQKDLLRQL